jgi:hypothetical protein
VPETVFSEAISKEVSSYLRKKYKKRTLSYCNIPRKRVAHICIEYHHQSCKCYGLDFFLTYPAGRGPLLVSQSLYYLVLFLLGEGVGENDVGA